MKFYRVEDIDLSCYTKREKDKNVKYPSVIAE